ncbi:MAG: glycosyltransferase [Pigmentiphaga sp.]|nr:glycosyltransferase [Pigmentiphaga sp.]
MAYIALISEHASPLAAPGSVDCGGQNVYVGQVARAFAAAGHEVDVFTRRDSPKQPESMSWVPGVHVVHVPAGPPRYLPKEKLLPFMAEFGRYLVRHRRRKAQRYDVMHANFFMSAQAALPAARAQGCPLVVTFHALGKVRRLHQQSADAFPDSRFAIEENIVRQADCLIAECAQDREDLLNLYDADAKRIRVVPCGYDSAEMYPQDMALARRRLGWAPAEFRVLQLGRLVPRKGVDNVIRAVARLRSGYGIEARLCIVGGDAPRPDAPTSAEMARLMGVCEEEGVRSGVEFAGRRDRWELADYYGASDVFVTTPWYEPFGITPLEAMACARPVVGADTGGIRSTVVDGQTGYLVPPRDPDALARRLAQLAADPALRRRMGMAGRRRAERLYTWGHVADELLNVYARLGDGDRRTRRIAEASVRAAA